MVLQRNIGTVDSSWLESDDGPTNTDLFVKIESDPDTEFGILRLTTRSNDWTGILDSRPEFGEDSSHTWSGGSLGPRDLKLSQTNDSMLEVSSVSFLNVNDDTNLGPWAKRDLQYNLKNRLITIWEAWWPPDDNRDASFQDSYILYRGRIGGREHKEISSLSVNPFGTSWNMRTGSMIQATVCRFAVSGLYGNTGEAAETCQVDMGDVLGTLATFPTCGGSLVECAERLNEVHFGGEPLMLKPNTTITAGGQRFTV